MANEWGPLGALAGEWEGEGGFDKAFAHAHKKVLDTPYLEKCSLKAFGPVVNGSQHLYGLDYKSTMWRGNEEIPFHAEVGYWLWDPATSEVLRGFVIPRGITVMAGGIAAADATEFILKASQDDAQYRICQNTYLANNATALTYEVKISSGSDTWSYDETTMVRLNEFDEPFAHTDHNTLRRVD